MYWGGECAAYQIDGYLTPQKFEIYTDLAFGNLMKTGAVHTAEMELLLRCFEKPTEDNPHCAYMTTTEILAYLGVYTHQPLTLKRMGEALKRAGFEKVSKRREGYSPVYVYKVRKIHPCPLVNSCSSLM